MHAEIQYCTSMYAEVQYISTVVEIQYITITVEVQYTSIIVEVQQTTIIVEKLFFLFSLLRYSTPPSLLSLKYIYSWALYPGVNCFHKTQET